MTCSNERRVRRRGGIVTASLALAAIVGGAGHAATVVARQTPAGQAPTAGARPPASPFVPPEPLDFQDHEGWTALFDGRTLTGWNGNPNVWSVANGAITAESTRERRVGSTHIIWTGGAPADFELKLEIKLEGDIHSGIAYRSFVDVGRGGGAGRGTPPAVPAEPQWTLYGPGLDFDQDRIMAGNVEDRGTPRREVAWRGGIARSEAGKRARLLGVIGDADALKALISADGWNQVHVIARGHQLTHIINGHVMAVLIDDDPELFRAKGLIGLQIEAYGFGRVNFRNIWLKESRP